MKAAMWSCTLQYGSQKLYVAVEQLKYGEFKLRYAIL